MVTFQCFNKPTWSLKNCLILKVVMWQFLQMKCLSCEICVLTLQSQVTYTSPHSNKYDLFSFPYLNILTKSVSILIRPPHSFNSRSNVQQDEFKEKHAWHHSVVSWQAGFFSDLRSSKYCFDFFWPLKFWKFSHKKIESICTNYLKIRIDLLTVFNNTKERSQRKVSDMHADYALELKGSISSFRLD